MNFKRISGLCNLVLVLAFLVHISGSPLLARITGTQPTSADIACWGPDGAEACVQDGGGLVPTTDNDAPLGTSSLRFSDVRSLDGTFGDDLTVTDDLTVDGDALLATGAADEVAIGADTTPDASLELVSGDNDYVLRVSSQNGSTDLLTIASTDGDVILIDGLSVGGQATVVSS